MNIVLINHYAGSPDMGMEFRPYYLAREWVKKEHKVDIFAADFSHLRIKNPSIQEDFQTEEIDGITYHWVKTDAYQGNGAKRAFTMFEFVGKMKSHAKKIAEDLQPDVVICSSTYPLDTYAGQKIKKEAERTSGKKAVLVHEVHDVWPATLTEIGGMSEGHPFVRLLQKAEDSAYQNSDKVVSLLPNTREHFMEHGMRKDKFAFIPNGIVEEDWESPIPLPQQHERLLQKIKAEGKFIVGYFGGHALSNALDQLLDVAKAVSDPDVCFVLMGNGVEKPRLMKRAEEEKLDHVLFLDPVSKKAIPSFCRMIDCSYMGAMESPLYRFGISFNKLFDSMRAGVPVLCEVTCPETYVEQYHCGYHVPSGDAAGAAEKIEELKKMSASQRRIMGENGRNAILQNYTYEKLAEQFEGIFSENK